MTWFIPSRFKNKSFNFCWIIPDKRTDFLLCGGSKMLEKNFNYDASRFKNYISSALSDSISDQGIKKNIFTCFSLTHFSICFAFPFRKIMEFVCYIGFVVLIDEGGKSAISAIRYLDILTRPCRKLRIWILLSMSEFAVI